MINVITNIRVFTINFINLILSVIYTFFILLIAPYFINLIALFCKHRTSRFLHSITAPWKRFNKRTLRGIGKLIIRICKYISLSIKFKSFNVLSKIEDLKESIMSLDPEEFEQFCAEVYRRLGYKATVTQFGNDGGKDIILIDKEHNLVYVECKRWHKESGREIGREICQKLIGSCAANGVKRAILVTTGKIHKNAFEYQKDINSVNSFSLEIVDFEALIQLYIKAYGIGSATEIRKNTLS